MVSHTININLFALDDAPRKAAAKFRKFGRSLPAYDLVVADDVLCNACGQPRNRCGLNVMFVQTCPMCRHVLDCSGGCAYCAEMEDRAYCEEVQVLLDRQLAEEAEEARLAEWNAVFVEHLDDCWSVLGDASSGSWGTGLTVVECDEVEHVDDVVDDVAPAAGSSSAPAGF
jgi:hypothetical protein